MTSHQQAWGVGGPPEMDLDNEPKIDTPPSTEELGTVQQIDIISSNDINHHGYFPQVTHSELQDQLAQLDLSIHDFPDGHQYGMSSNSTSRRPSLHASQYNGPAQPNPEILRAQSIEVAQDAIDVSQVPLVIFQPTLDGLNATDSGAGESIVPSPAQSLSNTPPVYDQPCRMNPDSNHDICRFLGVWRLAFEDHNISEPINQEAYNVRDWEKASIVSQDDTKCYDTEVQGIDWSKLGTTRDSGRMARRLYHQQLYNPVSSATKLADTEQLFQFRQMNLEHRAWIEHYQLCNLVVSTSQSDMYYVSKSKVMHTSPSSLKASCAMDLTQPTTISVQSGGFRITSLASAENLLVAGGYRGEYALQNLNSEYGTAPVKSHVSPNASVNHIHTFTSRMSGLPQAVFCSNDKHVRVLDCHTNSFVNHAVYENYVNCAATSPNGRLRLLVGDFEGSLVVDADSGRPLERLGGQVENAFACAWADDDIHVATAAQDCNVLIWDARNWSTPLANIACEVAYVTSLRFSPVGGGKRVLVAAEAADVVSIIDADTFDRKQVLDSFGDIGGICFSSDGSQLTVANSDRKFGGLITYGRSGFEGLSRLDDDDYQCGGSSAKDSDSPDRNRGGKAFEWLPEYELDLDPRVRLSAKARSRRGLSLQDVPF
jgi:WD40 repeat protein